MLNRFIDNLEYSSRFRILKGGKISLVVSALLAGLSSTTLVAAPSGGSVTSGVANISQSGTTTNIIQSTQKATINWQNFSIGANETVNFKQPNASSITLNRVVGNEKSIIDGALNANGQVWLLNSNGILFNSSAKVNTAGFLATTKNLSDEDFNKGNYTFSGDSSASVINKGTIESVNSSYVVFAANEVKNSGTIKAVKGKIHLVGADEISINLNGNSLLDLTVKKGVLDALVVNSGTIYADGGEIYLTTNAVDELLKGVVNNTGVIEANSMDDFNTHVELFAHGGTAEIGGTIKAKDGFVETSGKDFDFLGADIQAGEWLIDPVNVTIDATLAGAIESALGSGDVTIETDTLNYSDVDTSAGESGTDGDIFVNSAITWSSANKLTLDAADSIYINSAITATNGKLALYYGDSGDYNINAKVNLSAGANFFTKQASDGAETTWTVVTTGTDLQGMNGSLNGDFVLGADVDISSAWSPIGNGSGFFAGTFDGLGHTIDNLTINSGDSYLGLFGYTNGATIRNVGVTNVTITGSGSRVGGLVGVNTNSTITNSYVAGNITTNAYIASVGGLVGENIGSPINNSYATVNVEGSNTDSFVGGLVGVNAGSSTITNSYASGSITGSGSDVGGLVGRNYTSIINSFYDKDTNTAVMNDSGYGKTKEFILTAFSDKDGWAAGGATVAGYTTDSFALPLLKTFYTPTVTLFEGGYGTSTDAYTITNWTQLQNINNSNILTQNYYFKLLNNLGDTTSDYTNLASATANTNTGWNPIGDGGNNFSGTFDGLGHTIDKLFIDSSDTYLGLFGYINGATIKNLGVTNVDITGNSGTSNIGGLVGLTNSASRIENSYATGSVTGSITGSGSNIGGLVGYSGSPIENSYATVSVAGDGESSRVGGLIGLAYYSTITNSYASSQSITAHTSNNGIGGLIGLNTASIITNSYYDNETNTATMDDSTYGRTKAQIVTAFSNETGWTTKDASVAGYEVAVLPYLTGITRDEDKSTTTLFEGGLGIDGNAYTITNWTQLQNINNSNILTSNYYFSLLNNLGTTTDGYTDLASATANSGAGWTPIGDTLTNSFRGTFNGLDHTISNLNINDNTKDNVGLFGYVANVSNIKNLTLDNFNITGKNNVGALVGIFSSSGTIDNITVKNSQINGTDHVGGLIGDNGGNISNTDAVDNIVRGSHDVGGLIGHNYGVINNTSVRCTIGCDSVTESSGVRVYGIDDVGGISGGGHASSLSNSYSTVNIYGTSDVGGLVGFNDGTDISNSYSTSKVTGIGENITHIGGLVGDNRKTITNSYATGTVIGSGFYIGGLVGIHQGTNGTVPINALIENSYSTGSVTGNGMQSYVGGLVGGTITNSIINNSYATGSVEGTATSAYVGGLVGLTEGGTITKSYATGSVTGDATNANVGGLLGNRSIDITDSFYDTDTSGQTVGIGGTEASQAGVTGLTTAQMSYGQMFKDASWDIVADSSVTSTTPIIKYDSVNSKYVWAIAPLSLAYNLGTKTSIYDGTTQNLSDFYTTASSIFGSDYSFLTGTYKFQRDGSDVTGYKNAATYDGIKVASTNEFLAMKTSGNTDGTFTITPKVLSITAATTAEKVYDGLLTSNTTAGTLSGFVGNETVTASVVGTFANKNVGTNIEVADVYTLTNGTNGGLASNYSLANTTSTANITKKAITVSADDLNKVYGSAEKALTYTATGLVGSDTLTGSLKRVAGEDVNTYAISQDTTLANSNYTVTFENGIYTITPKAITVTADNKSKTYGENNPTLTFTTDGLISGDSLNGELSTTATISSDAGTYDITQGDLANGNYAITFNNGELTVLARNTPTPEPTPTPTPEPEPVPTPTPTPTEPTQNTEIKKEIDSIAKKQIQTPRVEPRVAIPEASPQQTQTQTVAMSTTNGQELEKVDGIDMENSMVPANKDSMLMVVNGGLNLPFGVSQEYYREIQEEGN